MKDVKIFQQNFFFEGEGTTKQFYFKPLTKAKETNKWKLKCVNISFYSSSTNDHIPVCVWLANCPMLSGFGNVTRDTDTGNNILLGVLQASNLDSKGSSAQTAHTTVVDTSFIVNEIKQDPFDLRWTFMTDPFNLDNTDTGYLSASFQITEMEC